MIRSYLQEIQKALAVYSWVKSVDILRCNIEETDIEEILIYRFRVILEDGGLLEFMERVVYSKHDSTFQVTTYKYHWQDKHHHLIKRWDNAPHFPNLEGFPYHIHIEQEDKVFPNKPMTAIEMLAIIDQEFLEE